MFGILATATSIGAVMELSTSCTANDGASAITCTWLFVISGVASIGNWVREYVPQPISAITNKPIINLFFIEKWIKYAIRNSNNHSVPNWLSYLIF